MGKVVYLINSQDKQIFKPQSFLEMILDSIKRKETFLHYDNKYEETDEEREIFEEMARRRRL